MEGSLRRRPYRRSVGFPAIESRTRQHRRAALPFYLLTTLTLMGSLLGARSAPPDIGKGPVGWDIYRQLDSTMELRSGAETRELSSTDPAQANGDFNHPLRVTSNGEYVIAEASGPGEVESIWSTINGITGSSR